VHEIGGCSCSDSTGGGLVSPSVCERIRGRNERECPGPVPIARSSAWLVACETFVSPRRPAQPNSLIQRFDSCHSAGRPHQPAARTRSILCAEARKEAGWQSSRHPWKSKDGCGEEVAVSAGKHVWAVGSWGDLARTADHRSTSHQAISEMFAFTSVPGWTLGGVTKFPWVRRRCIRRRGELKARHHRRRPGRCQGDRGPCDSVHG
jgi:hypothetical protein